MTAVLVPLVAVAALTLGFTVAASPRATRRRRAVARRTEMLVATVADALRAHDPQSADRAVETLAHAIGASTGALGLVEGDALVLRGHYRLRDSARGRTVARGEGVAGRVWVSGRSRIVDDLRDEPAYIQDVDGARSAIYVPGLSGGRVIVVLGFDASRTAAFDERHERVLAPVADLIAAAVDSRRQLDAAHRREDELLATVGTQLRGPLTSIVGNLETLDHRGAQVEPETAKQLLGAAARATATVTRLVDSLTLAADGTANARAARLTTIRLPDPLDLALGRLRREVTQLPVTVTPSLHAAPPVLGDPEQLVTVVAELLHRALRNGATAVTVTAEARDDVVALSIRDDGPALSAATLEALHVGTADDVAAAAGVGVIVARRLVERMHARLVFRSHPERGTTAEILLPSAG